MRKEDGRQADSGKEREREREETRKGPGDIRFRGMQMRERASERSKDGKEEGSSLVSRRVAKAVALLPVDDGGGEVPRGEE